MCANNMILTVSLVDVSVNLQLVARLVILVLSVWIPSCACCLTLLKISSL